MLDAFPRSAGDRVETKMPFSIFAKMRKSCENGPIFAKFREISFSRKWLRKFKKSFKKVLSCKTLGKNGCENLKKKV
jgi:hypothetical protein